MAVPTIVVLVLVAVATLVAVALLVIVVARRLTGLAHELEQLERRLGPALEQLQQDADVTGRELARVSETLDELSRSRDERR